MMKYVSKFAMDILPSVVATIIGAYIVNHYIVAKPDAPAAAAMSSADPRQADAKPSETSSDLANIPPAGVRAKGIKAIFERSADKAVEKPAEKPAEKPVEKSADKPTETASIPADTRRSAPAPHEKTAVAKTPAVTPVASPVQPVIPAVVPVVAAPVTVPPVEAAVAPEVHRDATDLARAAIERLRGIGDAPRAQEATRVPEAPRAADPARVVSVPVVTAPQQTSMPVRPLPPPIMVSTPSGEAFDSPTGSSPMRPYPSSARIDDPRRPTPPADIPSSGPLDLRAEAVDPVVREHTSVADDVLSAAKSVFHAVLPK
jgi:hypothetical protein